MCVFCQDLKGRSFVFVSWVTHQDHFSCMCARLFLLFFFSLSCIWVCANGNAPVLNKTPNVPVSHSIANWQNLICQPPVAAEGLTRSRTLSRMIANHCFKVCQSSVVTSNAVTSDEVFLINCAHGGKSRVSAIFPAYHVCWLYKCSNWNVKQASRGTIFTQNSSHMVRIAGQLLSIAGAEHKKHFENEF